MDDTRTKQALQLLRTASDRQKRASGENATFNLLSALHIEHYETQTHSRIISFLLNDIGRSDGKNDFLYLFLQTLKVPKAYLSEEWSVYREMVFDGGRIDFVIESRSFCAIIEMKVGAGDGDSQLNRYASFGKKKRKKYRIYYLTPYGYRPEEQSAKDVDEDKLVCISFEKEIVSWLQDCLNIVDKSGYKYSFIKQYLGAVKQICKVNDGVISVTDLLNSSEMARAALIVMDSFYDKMDEVKEQFFKRIGSTIKRKANLETNPYTDSVDILLESFTYRKHIYYVVLCPSTYSSDELIVDFGFTEKTEEGYTAYMTLEKAEATFPSIYRRWIDKLEALGDMPRINQSQRTRWFYAEDTQGAKLNFKNYSAQIGMAENFV